MPKKLTKQQFIDRSQAQHGSRYDYSQVEYVNNIQKVKIRCEKHGEFSQQPNHHMDGRGCPECKKEAISARCKHEFSDFLRKARSVHGDTYDYSKVAYQKASIKIEIGCKRHGSFWQTPNNHTSKKAGCPKCAGKSMTTADFIEKAVAVHGDRYSYENTDYRLIKEKITITCQKHGNFSQSAESHLIGCGCNQCWHESYSSKDEQELSQWIASLGLAVANNDRAALKKRLEIDVYLPALRIGIEYNGCYWHSDKVEKNTRKNEFKHLCAQTDDIRLITVWDYDWKTKPEVVKRHLLHAFDLNPSPRINARSCAITPITGTEANRFYAEHHLQGPCRGGVIHIGLRHKDTLVAAMSFTQGATRRGKNESGEWELARYATSAIVRGGASRLFKQFIQQTGAEKVWSFSDQQHFAGKLYETLGFEKDGELPSDYKVVNPNSMRVWHKSLWQRKNIPKRIEELGSSETFDPKTDPRTEQQMQDQLRVLRVWDAGKIRWLWKTLHP